MATIGTRLFTMFKGEIVGRDEFGNRYYREKRGRSGRRPRRWVIYNGADEPSSVPPTWHGWLHNIMTETPAEKPLETKLWEKPHLPNLTGTPSAYRPPGHVLEGGRRDKATGDYEPWRPE